MDEFLLTTGSGLCVESWNVKKVAVVSVKYDRNYKFSGRLKLRS